MSSAVRLTTAVPRQPHAWDRFTLRALWRAHRLVIVTAVLLCVVLVSAVAALPAAPGNSAAPLIEPNAHGWLLEDARVGHRFSDGLELLRLQTESPITITDIRSIGGAKGLKLIGVRVAGDERATTAEQYSPHFPPRAGKLGPLRTVLGESLPARPGPRHEAWQLVLGYRVTRPGIWERTGLEIDYIVDGQAHTARYPSSLLVCTRGLRQECNRRYDAPGY